MIRKINVKAPWSFRTCIYKSTVKSEGWDPGLGFQVPKVSAESRSKCLNPNGPNCLDDKNPAVLRTTMQAHVNLAKGIRLRMSQTARRCTRASSHPQDCH
jgi:hypothetical protein